MKPTILPMQAVAVPVSTDEFMTASKRPVLMRQVTREDIDVDVNNIGLKLADLDDILRNSLENSIVVDNLFDAENENVPTL